jgi:serine/threonine-protein kinase
MSPEQATADKVDGRADVYALGCVLYEMLSGGEPFTAPTAQGLLARHVHDPVPDVRTVRPSVSDSVWFAIQKAMAKSPADRFKTAGEFLSASRRPETESRGQKQGHGSWWPWRRDKQ